MKAQDYARRQADKANEMIVQRMRDMRRTMTSIAFWQNRASHYAKRAAMTDAQLEAEKASRLAYQERRKARSRKRGVEIGGDL